MDVTDSGNNVIFTGINETDSGVLRDFYRENFAKPVTFTGHYATVTVKQLSVVCRFCIGWIPHTH